MEDLKGIELNAVSEWLNSHLNGLPAPYTFHLIPAGGSNLTYKVQASNNEWFVLRRPPISARLATAHDMSREYRLMNALKNTAVPVPEMLAYCDDDRVTGAHFYCMEMVPGICLADLASVGDMTKAQCDTATESLVDAQVAFHTVDLEAIGLNDFARHDGYVERQLKRWIKQIDAGKTRDVPLFNRLHDNLIRSIPIEQKPGLAHGDYRFDNCLLNGNFQVAAVLDWELCTIGDPAADFVWSLNYWSEPGESLTWLLSPPTQHPNFCDRAQVAKLYSERSGISLDDMDWYTAFSWWKQAAIVEGVYNRLKKGATGGLKVDSIEAVADRVDQYLAKAESLIL